MLELAAPYARRCDPGRQRGRERAMRYSSCAQTNTATRTWTSIKSPSPIFASSIPGPMPPRGRLIAISARNMLVVGLRTDFAANKKGLVIVSPQMTGEGIGSLIGAPESPGPGLDITESFELIAERPMPSRDMPKAMGALLWQARAYYINAPWSARGAGTMFVCFASVQTSPPRSKESRRAGARHFHACSVASVTNVHAQRRRAFR